MLSIRELVKVYPGPVAALQGVSLELDTGVEHVAGMNGNFPVIQSAKLDILVMFNTYPLSHDINRVASCVTLRAISSRRREWRTVSARGRVPTSRE